MRARTLTSSRLDVDIQSLDVVAKPYQEGGIMKVRSKTHAKRSAVVQTKTEARLATSVKLKRAQSLLDLIARRMQRIKEDFFEIGVALRELEDKKLFAALGYDTFDAMLEARSPIGRSQAYKLIAIVKHVTREQALELGAEKAYALSRFVRATPEADTVASVIDGEIRVGRAKRAISEMSRREIEAATRSLTRAKKSPSPEERDVRRAAREAQSTLRKRALRATVTVEHALGRWWAVVRLPAKELPSLVNER